MFIHSHCKVRSHNPKGGCPCREKKKNPCFRSHILCPKFEHNYFAKPDYRKREWVKQFVLIQSNRPLHTFIRKYPAAWMQKKPCSLFECQCI